MQLLVEECLYDHACGLVGACAESLPCLYAYCNGSLYAVCILVSCVIYRDGAVYVYWLKASLFPLAVPVLVFCILHGICDAYVGQNEAFQGFVHLLPVVSVLLYIPHDAVLCILKALKAHYAQVVCKQVAGNLYHAVLAFYFDICNYIFHNY